MLIAFYIVLHLAVAGVIVMVTGKQASVAIAPDRPAVPTATANASDAALAHRATAALGMSGRLKAAARTADCQLRRAVDSDSDCNVE
jgi:hypothetical protein